MGIDPKCRDEKCIFTKKKKEEEENARFILHRDNEWGLHQILPTN